MVNNIYLCGHTGSVNRGCEAILRSTSLILKKVNVNDITAMTFDEKYDRKLHLDCSLKLIPYPKRKLIVRALSRFNRIAFNKGVWGSKFFYYDLFKNLPHNSAVFNVGGDTYCYGSPYISYALNELADKHKTPSIFWGCSVNELCLTDKKCKQT